MATKNIIEKTFSVKEAVDKIGLCRAIVSRLCQRGIVGTRYEFPGIDQFVYRLSSDDLETLKERKKDWENKIQKKNSKSA